ncbi:MAG: hypothetical protein M3O50_21035, partial [Myxococcota bacterium]|nr:hypothetical protein [Myxococcota bacterium]
MKKTSSACSVGFAAFGVALGGAAFLHCGLDGSGINPNDCHASNTCLDDAGADGTVADADAGPPSPPAEAGVPDAGRDAEPTVPESGILEGGAVESSPCASPTGLLCQGTCVEPSRDPQHCGSCEHRCGGPEGGTGTATCTGSVCGIGCTGATPLECGGSCVDPGRDPQHCGGCGVACAVPDAGHMVATCTSVGGGGGTCGTACESGYHACGGACLPNGDSPSVDPCVVSESYGVFVSPAGSDVGGDGTRAHPYGTLGHAMDKASGASHRVYACGSAGSYVESLVVGMSPPRDGLHVYGGLDCTTTPGTWVYSASALATVAPGAGPALQVTGLSAGVSFEDMAFVASSAPSTPPASGAGASSVAVVVNGASGVVFTRGRIVAGDGQPGAAGVLVPYTFPAASALDGNSAVLTMGGAAQSVTCPGGGVTVGGKGGPPGGNGAAGQPNLGGGQAGIAGMNC